MVILWVVPLRVAESTADTSAVVVAAVIEKFADDDPAASVTEAGLVSNELLVANWIAIPLEGAG
jgi:hypothetical protein